MNPDPKAIENNFQPGWYLRSSRGVGIGNWERMCICANCGLRGSDYDLGRYSPCPRCGEVSVTRRTGRFVTTRRTLLFAVRGYWELKEELSEHERSRLMPRKERSSRGGAS